MQTDVYTLLKSMPPAVSLPYVVLEPFHLITTWLNKPHRNDYISLLYPPVILEVLLMLRNTDNSKSLALFSVWLKQALKLSKAGLCHINKTIKLMVEI